MGFNLNRSFDSMNFPCSVCLNKNQDAKYCKGNCGIYNLSEMELFDLNNEVQELIESYANRGNGK